MTRRFQRRALSLILATSVAWSQVTPAAHADPRPASVEAWEKSTSARLVADGSLSDVLALSATNVWAVGQQQIWDVWKNRGTIRHWDGTRWAEVAIRDTAGTVNLRGVAAASASDVWAVGDGVDGLPYLAHGDTGGFSRVRVEGLWAGDWLGGVDARTGRVVAVGSGKSRDQRSNKMVGLVVVGEDGRWTVRDTDAEGALYAVAEGIAVGDTGTGPLIVHESGDTWKAVPVPDIPGGYLRDVQVDSSKRAMAVGGVYHGPGDVEPLVLSWNGKRWKREKLPATASRLYGVTGDGKGRYWAAGYDPAQPVEPFMLRYEKGDWEIIRGGAARGRDSVRLQAVTYLPGKGAVWAVGHAVDTAERYTDVVESFGAGSPPPKDS
ncbi:hypothetical protein AB0C18_03095 [Nonomuraea muscovyensis]|uniref:hypothetical protein n=1 Tax=Nonomuraea muscovyensis TaxID=1124761 RepID=UPI0033F309AA|nr:hypothetical protein [Nonomuraea muscovyensis]